MFGPGKMKGFFGRGVWRGGHGFGPGRGFGKGDLGYVRSDQQNGKKVYSITSEGRKFLEENRQSVDDIWGRAGEGWDPGFAAEMREIGREVKGIGRMFGSEMRAGRIDRE